MTRDKIFSQVKTLIVDEGFLEDHITEAADLRDDIGMDSLDAVECVMAIEEHYGINITDEDAAQWKTVRDIVDYLANPRVGLKAKSQKPGAGLS